jgi:unsaturated rhamnogalacturonyl hydrolase
MMKALRLLSLLIALTACSAKAPLSVQVVRSEMARCPEASWLDGREGTLKWNYTTGLELLAFLDVYDRYGDTAVFNYVDAWYDAIIDEDGRIPNYKRSNYTVDHICPGRTLFRLYELTGKEKYRKVMDTLYHQIREQPRTPEGGFWHKKIYPQQMWLDGLYMAEPFYALYTAQFVPDSLKACNYADIAHQFALIYDRTFDPATGLLRHAWDSSHEMFWCNPETGQSEHAWGRAMGWYAMALVDVIPMLPEGEEREMLERLLNRVFTALPLFADPASGMWYQVLDRPGETGNYLEATCNAMFAYALLKGTRLELLENITREDARRTYEALLKCFVRTDAEGLVNLDSCCEVAGLGGKQMRRGDYDYYINEPVRSNDPKGIGPLVWAALEYEMK